MRCRAAFCKRQAEWKYTMYWKSRPPSTARWCTECGNLAEGGMLRGGFPFQKEPLHDNGGDDS